MPTGMSLPSFGSATSRGYRGVSQAPVDVAIGDDKRRWRRSVFERFDAGPRLLAACRRLGTAAQAGQLGFNQRPTRSSPVPGWDRR